MPRDPLRSALACRPRSRVSVPLPRACFSRQRTAAAFTLLELLIVLALIAVVGGLAASGIVASQRGDETRAALMSIVDAATLARTEAMRTARATSVTVALDGEHLRLTYPPRGETRRRWGGVRPIDAAGQLATLSARFDSLGRSDTRSWRIEQVRGGSGRGEAVRIWQIEFDPVSGAPSVHDTALDRPSKEAAR